MRKLLVFAMACVVLACTCIEVEAGTAKVLKTEGSGSCSGGAKFKWKYTVDVNDDNVADAVIIVWCNNNVSVTPPVLTSGSWPSDVNTWYTVTNDAYQTESGKTAMDFTVKRVSDNVTIGTMQKDTNSSSLSVVFYSQMLGNGTPSGFDPRVQQPKLVLSQRDQQPTLNFQTYESGRHVLVVTLRNPDGNEYEKFYSIDSDGFAEVQLQLNVEASTKVVNVRVDRPKDWHDSFDLRK